MDSDRQSTLLQGDIGSDRRRNVCRWVIERLAERFFAVYYIPGNYYAYDGTVWDRCESPAPGVGSYHFGTTLVDDTVTAATLWTDCQRGNPLVGESCRGGINDFCQNKRIRPARVKTRHHEHLAVLDANIQSGGVVLTHFAPSWQSISPDYESSEVNGYYGSDLEDLLVRKRPARWVHDHIQSRSD